MDKKILIKNVRTIVSCDGEDRVYRDAGTFIEDLRILAIGRGLMNQRDPVSGREWKQEEAQVIQTGGKFAYLGLIDTHHCFFQTSVCNLITIDYLSMVVMDWADKIYHIFQNIDSDVIYYSTLISSADLIKHGCTCALDHQYCYTRKTGKSPVDRQMGAAELLGIRYHAGGGTNTLSRSEGSSIPDNMLETTDESLKDCDRLVGLYHNPRPFSMKQIVMALCQSINCRRDTFAETVAMAREKGVKMHTHPGGGENEGMIARWGKRTMGWYEEMDFIGGDVWYAHDWEVTKGEYKVLAATGTGVSRCPASAVLGGFPILDIKEMQEVGILVSLGCDGSATNDSSNLLNALRMAYLVQAYHTKERGGRTSAYDMLKVATVNGTRTLGRTDLGTLETRKTADPFMIDTETLELTGALHDPKNLLAGVGLTGSVWVTMISGNTVYKDGILKSVDERKLATDGEAVHARVIQEPHSAYRDLIQRGIWRKEERRLAGEGIFFYRGIGGAVRA